MKPSFLLLALVASTLAGNATPAKPAGLGVAKVQTAPASNPARKSVILHDGTNWTIVPTAALVFLPASVRDKVDAKPVGQLLPWADFLAENASWITTTEVSFDQAAGNQVLPAGRINVWKAQDKLVVAVHHDAPVPVTVGHDLRATTRR